MKIKKTSQLTVCSILLCAFVFTFLTGCATRQAAPDKETAKIYPAKKPAEKYIRDDIVYSLDAYDPWEGFNRHMYVFNYNFDKYVFLPVVSAYEWAVPDYLEDRISGIFKNMGELGNFTNNLLQFKGKRTAITTGRFLVNTTVGLAGMYDPATRWGMYVPKEDFGQTLGHYGVGAGPYLVLPILGPSNLRDGTGTIFDTLVHSAVLDWAVDDAPTELGINFIRALDVRHRTTFRYYQSGSPFEYDFIRKLYLEKRKIDIAK